MSARRALVTLFLIGALASAGAQSSAGGEPGPWEPSDLGSLALEPPPPLRTDLPTRLYEFYQTHISEKSVDRCPFHVSCSEFAKIAVQEEHLLVAAIMFIDRNQFRENPLASTHYPWVIGKTRRIELDDNFYLYGNR